MPDPSNDKQSDKGKEKRVIRDGQPIGGNDSGTGSGTPLAQGAEFGDQGATGQAQLSTGSEPPRSMGNRGSEFGHFGDATGPAGQQGQSATGQADLGIQAAATLAGRSDQQDLGIDQPGSVGGAGGSTGEGFIGAQGSGSDDYLQHRQSPASARAIEGTDFAPHGRGATEDQDENSGEGHPS